MLIYIYMASDLILQRHCYNICYKDIIFENNHQMQKRVIKAYKMLVLEVILLCPSFDHNE